jgi:flagellar basal-body rod protein FlgC
MSLFNALAVSASGMTSNRLWIDLIANNISNVNSTSTVQGADPYRRKVPMFTEVLRDVQKEGDNALQADFDFGDHSVESMGAGVQTFRIAEDRSPFKLVHNPGNPNADAHGFVKMPNIDVINEMVDMISANRAYDASVQTANAAKAMVNKALEIGK